MYNKEIDKLKRELEKCTLEKQQLQAQVDAIRQIVSVNLVPVPDNKTRSQDISPQKAISSAATQDPLKARTRHRKVATKRRIDQTGNRKHLQSEIKHHCSPFPRKSSTKSSGT